MADTIAYIEPEGELTVTTSQEGTTVASSNLANPAVVESMDDIADVDMSTNGKIDGSILVYKTNTSKWTATTLLNQQEISAGQF
jgi:uncharacterized membrane protein YcaP (DUF421 family)